MERIDFSFSLKNIPYPSKKAYINLLIAQTEKFIKNLRWRVFFFKNDSPKNKGENNFGFKSGNSPPPDPELKPFEDDLRKMIKCIKFAQNNQPNDEFQKMLKTEMTKIKSDKRIIIPADKTHNWYFIEPKEYEQILRNNVTNLYKIAEPDKLIKANAEAKEISKYYGIEDRANRYEEKTCFINAKDHKENFESNPTYRLINPACPHLGKASKLMLDKINANIRQKCNVNQWRSTEDTIRWFVNLEKSKNP